MVEKEEPQEECIAASIDEEYIVTSSDVYNAHNLYSEYGYADGIAEFYKSLERIVRCKDCKRLIPKGEEFFIDCNKAEREACGLFSDHDIDYDWTSFFYVKPDDFCAWGERRAVE